VFCNPKRTNRGVMFAGDWVACPDQTFQYSYKVPTSSPMSYPKCEMKFPHGHSRVQAVAAINDG